MNKSDFAPFTKDELIDYIMTHSFDSIEKPLRYLYGKRLNHTMLLIDICNEKGGILCDKIPRFDAKLDPNGFLAHMKKISDNQAEWSRLNKIYDKYSKKLYGEGK